MRGDKKVSGLVTGTSKKDYGSSYSCDYYNIHHALVVYSGWGMEDMCTSYTSLGQG